MRIASNEEKPGRRSDVSSIEDAASTILALRLPHPIRVAVDGRTASGKTTFADLLAAALRQSSRSVIRASIDGFHQPKAIRHRRGRLSPDGYYEDARDFAAVRKFLLDPLGPGGDLRYLIATFDLERDAPLEKKALKAGEDAVLLVDGTFLQRPELKDAWDFIVFLDVAEEEARQRGVARDALALGGAVGASELYIKRYAPAFTRYEMECSPRANADVVIGK